MSSEGKLESLADGERLSSITRVDPLARLYQMDEIEFTLQDRESLLLITRLLDNVEEFYALREQLVDIMATDEMAGGKILNLFNAMIQALKVEQSYLGKIDPVL